MDTDTVTLSETGVTVSCTHTAKDASAAGALTFLPTGDDLKDLAPEDIQESAIDPNAVLAYTLPLDQIPQSGGMALLELNLAVDYDVYDERVQCISRKKNKSALELPLEHREPSDCVPLLNILLLCDKIQHKTETCILSRDWRLMPWLSFRLSMN